MNKKKISASIIMMLLSLTLLTPNYVYGENHTDPITYNRGHGSSGNFFDDFIDHDKDDDNQIDENDGSYTDDLGLAAGIETKTDVYSDVALVLAAISCIMSICFFVMYLKRNRNHY